jgi:uncharacterized protein YecE (DUF72 family)
MRLLAGTSGFSYKEWVGEFYPAKTQPKAMLAYYATRLPTVEINNTFYRMPTRAQLTGWRAQVSDAFRFAVKAPRRVSHIKRLRDCGDEMRVLLDGLAALGPCLGSVLVQLPPFFKVDVAALADFAAVLPAGCRAAFEFRNPSWLVDEVLDVLRGRDFALVQSESEEGYEPLPWTADWAYLRLRKAAYSDAELRAWLERLRAAGVSEAQVFFKHEDAATGPKLAERLLELAGEAA